MNSIKHAKELLPIGAISLAGVAMLLLGARAFPAEEIAGEALNLEAIQRMVPGAPIPMPGEVLTPAYRKLLMEQKDRIFTPVVANRANEHLKTPAATWRDRIPVRVGFGWLFYGGITDQFNKTCPACRRPVRFGKVDEYRGTVTVDCCGAVFHEDPSQYPANAPGKPNRTMKIPHWDGKALEYPYFEFADLFPADQGWSPWTPADGSRKHEIFLADGYIRAMRLKRIIEEVLPDLGWAGFYTGQEQYAELAAAIFDRLAELYPTWPLWLSYGNHYNFALNRAGNGVLTRAEFEGAIRPMKWGTQFWNTWDRSFGFGHDKMAETVGAQYAMRQVSFLAKAYATIRNSEGARKCSKERYGQPEKLDQQVMRNLFGEMAKLYKCYQPWFGNHTQAYVEGGIFLSLLTQDRYFFDAANELMERSLYDESYADHITTQGSCDYWGMFYGPLLPAFQFRERVYDPEVKRNHPRLRYIADDHLKKQLASYRWIAPSFGDAWNLLYPSPRGLGQDTKPASEFFSQHDPDFGISMLRWGQAEGRRQEVCLAYQRVGGHTHSDPLGIEFFVDGLPIVWDMGYGNGTLDTDVNRHPEMKEIVAAGWPRPVFDTGPYFKDGQGAIPIGHWWSAEWTHRTPAHCTVMVDESEPATAWGPQATPIPVTLMPGCSTHGNPEVVDVQMRDACQGKPSVSEYRRTLMTVPTPSGGGYAVDIFRVTGGKMHEFYYHAISETSKTDLPSGKTMPGALANYREVTRKQTDKMKELENPQSLQTAGWSHGYRHINELKQIEDEPVQWKLDWVYDPAAYAPRTREMRDRFKDLLAVQKPVALSIHGVRQPGSEQKAMVWRARGLLTGHLNEVLKDGTRLDGGWHSTVGFVGGLDMLILERQGEPDLKSTFVHVLEGRRADLPPEVMEVSNLTLRKKAEDAVAISVKLDGGYTDYIVCLPVAGEIKSKELQFKGCYGFARLDADGKPVAAAMVRGTRLQFGKKKLKARPEYVGTAVKFVGDLTGDRSQPAIIVKTRQTLPEGSELAGNPVNVIAADGWTDVFWIESIASLGHGEWRIALKNHPTFIIDFLTVWKADAQDAKVFYAQEIDLSKAICNATYGHHVWLVSLRTGKRYPVNLDTDNGKAAKLTLLDEEASFKKSGLQNGEPAILLRHFAGDQVVIPLAAGLN